MQRVSISRPLAVASLALVTMAGSVSGQQPQTRAREFMRDVIGFSPKDLASLDSGKTVTRLLDTKEKGEVAAFGAVVINAEPAVLFEQAKDMQKFRRVPQIEEIGFFSDPPRVEDLAGLTLPEDDVEDLRKCKPGKCNVKLGEDFIATLARHVNWKAPDAEAKAARLAKERLIEVVEAYQRGGTATLGVVVDKKRPKARSAEFEKLLGNSPYLFEYVPEFNEYLREFPTLKRENVRDVFYWTKDTFGLKPTVSIYHVTTQMDGGTALMAQKLLYASHYFNAGLELWAVSPHPSGERFDLLMLYRTRLDPPTGMLAGVLLRKVRNGVQTGVRENLKSAKAKTEAAAR
jgi:hypothetical protein